MVQAEKLRRAKLEERRLGSEWSAGRREAACGQLGVEVDSDLMGSVDIEWAEGVNERIDDILGES